MAILEMIKNRLKGSSTFMNITYKMLFLYLWPILKLEKLLSRLTVIIIRKSHGLLAINNKSTLPLLTLIARHIMPHRLNPDIVMKMQKLGVTIPSSVKSAISLRHNINNGIKLPEWHLNDKMIGVKFMDALGVACPDNFQRGVKLVDIKPREYIVIKPMTGASARGVFAVKTMSEILDFERGIILGNWKDFLDRARLMIRQSSLQVDSWIVEQYICTDDGVPANDVKYFCFYGEVGLVALIRRFPSYQCGLFDLKGNEYDAGEGSTSKLFSSRDVSHKDIRLAEWVSSNIPVPCIRIDFLKGHDRLYFGEFTPGPGLFTTMDRTTDMMFGKMFHDAEARLYRDLVNGKKFDAFIHTVGQI